MVKYIPRLIIESCDSKDKFYNMDLANFNSINYIGLSLQYLVKI